MDVQVLSDLHLHRGNPLPWLANEAEIVIVAGNLAPIQRGEYLRAAAAQWANAEVLYVPGPVEFYGADIDTGREQLAEACQTLGVTLLDRRSVTIEGVRFIGATLWTDMRLNGSAGEQAAHRTAQRTEDFDGRIRHDASGGKLTPHEAARRHALERAFIERELVAGQEEVRAIVVITHHAPSSRCIPSWFAGEPLSASYASDLDRLITQYQPWLWIHGHVTYPVSEDIGDTRVMANPHGPHRTSNLDFWPDLIVGARPD